MSTRPAYGSDVRGATSYINSAYSVITTHSAFGPSSLTELLLNDSSSNSNSSSKDFFENPLELEEQYAVDEFASRVQASAHYSELIAALGESIDELNERCEVLPPEIEREEIYDFIRFGLDSTLQATAVQFFEACGYAMDIDPRYPLHEHQQLPASSFAYPSSLVAVSEAIFPGADATSPLSEHEDSERNCVVLSDSIRLSSQEDSAPKVRTEHITSLDKGKGRALSASPPLIVVQQDGESLSNADPDDYESTADDYVPTTVASLKRKAVVSSGSGAAPASKRACVQVAPKDDYLKAPLARSSAAGHRQTKRVARGQQGRRAATKKRLDTLATPGSSAAPSRSPSVPPSPLSVSRPSPASTHTTLPSRDPSPSGPLAGVSVPPGFVEKKLDEKKRVGKKSVEKKSVEKKSIEKKSDDKESDDKESGDKKSDISYYANDANLAHCPVGGCSSTFQYTKGAATAHVISEHARTHPEIVAALTAKEPEVECLVCHVSHQIAGYGRHIMTHVVDKPFHFWCKYCGQFRNCRDPNTMARHAASCSEPKPPSRRRGASGGSSSGS